MYYVQVMCVIYYYYYYEYLREVKFGFGIWFDQAKKY